MQGYIKEYNEFEGIGVISSLYGDYDFDIKDWRSQDNPALNLVVEFMAKLTRADLTGASGTVGIAFSVYSSNPREFVGHQFPSSNPREFVGHQFPSDCPCSPGYRWVATRTWWAVSLVTLLFPVTWFSGIDSNLALAVMGKGAEMYLTNMLPIMAFGLIPVICFDFVISSFKKDVKFLEIVIMAMTLIYSMFFLRQTIGLFQNVSLDSSFGVCCTILAALFCVRLTK